MKDRAGPLGDISPLGIGSRIFNGDPLLYVTRHHPTITWVRLSNIDDKELGLVFVLFVQPFERANLAPERRSGIAAENQHNRTSRSDTR